MTQAELTILSHVSKTAIREILRNIIRRRSPRMLCAISEALDWHSDHLDAVLHGRRPPAPKPQPSRPQTTRKMLEEIGSRLDTIERRLDQMMSSLTR